MFGNDAHVPRDRRRDRGRSRLWNDEQFSMFWTITSHDQRVSNVQKNRNGIGCPGT